MRNASLESEGNEVVQMLQTLYGMFDLDLCGRPTQVWENRNLKRFKPPEMLEHAFFPKVYLARVLVNRRMLGPIGRVYEEIAVRWNAQARAAHGLNQFFKCYCFGDGAAPNLFWYGGAWELSPAVGGDTLSEVVKIFTRHGFTHAFATDKRRPRVFEYW